MIYLNGTLEMFETREMLYTKLDMVCRHDQKRGAEVFSWFSEKGSGKRFIRFTT